MSTARHRAPAAGPGGAARDALGELAHLLLPVGCGGCGEPDVALCRRCRWALAGPAGTEREVDGVPVVRVVAYAGAAQRVLLGWKDDGRHDLAPLVRAGVARSVRGALVLAGPRPVSQPVLVVPVPSSAAASRRRGGDVLAGVTRDAVRALTAQGWPVEFTPLLRQRSRVADQAGLAAAARRRNLSGALAVRPGWDPAGATAVLVDDVVTTGATLQEGIRALRGAGAQVLAGAVVAATPRRHPDRGG